MSRLSRQPRAIGMDCCDTSCKAVVLSRRGSGIRVTGANYLSCQTDGFLSAGELHHAFGEWLAQNNLRKHPACCGIPQYHVNTLISDLPPVSNRQKLAQMVDYQTRHLGGLTGEELLNDFQELPPTPNQANPVLIALCRSSVLEERLEYLTDLRALVTQFTGNGIALANAFQALQPVAFDSGAIQAVVDAGRDESIMALFCHRSLQLIAVLPGLDDNGGVQRLAEESAVTVRRWQDSNRTGFRMPPAQLWLSGDGALDENLPHVLSSALGHVPVSILGLPLRQCPAEVHGAPSISGVYPCLTIAYGLALQGLGEASAAISLIPGQLAERKRRADAYPWLFGAWLLFTLLLAITLYRFNQNTHILRQELETREKAINTCLDAIPRLENAYHQIGYQQRRMLPIAEIGYRSKRFLETIKSWQNATRGNTRTEWCIYMADEFSFNEANKPAAEPGTENPQEGERKGTATRRAKQETPPAAAAPFTLPENPLSPKESSEIPLSQTPLAWNNDALLPVNRMPLLSRMYIAGIASQDESRYQAVKELQQALNDSECFENVDDYADLVTPAFTGRYLAAWENFITAHRQKLNQEYTVFLLQLPFCQTSVTLPLPPPAGETAAESDE